MLDVHLGGMETTFPIAFDLAKLALRVQHLPRYDIISQIFLEMKVIPE